MNEKPESMQVSNPGLAQVKPNQSSREPMENNESFSNQGTDKEKVREGLMVHAKGSGRMGGATGVHVGTVDHLDGNYVKLAKKDSFDGEHHWIPCDWIESVDNKALYLSVDENAFHAGLLNESPFEKKAIH